MAQCELTGWRGQEYSLFHRVESFSRFTSRADAFDSTMIDMDAVFCSKGMMDTSGSLWIEADKRTAEPCALIETAKHSTLSEDKCCVITQKLAQRARLPGFLVLYELYRDNEHWLDAAKRVRDIERFWVKRLWPNPWDVLEPYTPKRYVEFLLALRKSSTEIPD